MTKICAVLGFSNRSNRESETHFFRVPKENKRRGEIVGRLTKQRRERWLANLSLLVTKGAESKHARVCSDHFVKGRPSDLYDVQNDDCAPTLKLGHKIQIKTSSNGIQQQSESTMENNNEIRQTTTVPCGSRQQEQQQQPQLQQQQTHQQQQQQSEEILPLGLHPTEPEASLSLISDVVVCDGQQPTMDTEKEIGCQTDLIMDDINGIEKDDQNLRSELYELRSASKNLKLNEQSFKDNEEKMMHYTGLPNVLVLMQVFHCENYVSTTSQSVLGKFEQFILVLMRLRLNLPLKDLAYRFGISPPTVSRIWHKWIPVLYKRTQFLIQWTEHDILQATMPIEFRKTFAWGGRASDKTIVEESEILKKLLPGDVVLADRGFNVEESVGLYAASLKIPAFTRGKLQLSTQNQNQNHIYFTRIQN